MSVVAPSGWLNPFLDILLRTQLFMQDVMYLSGLAGDSHGQPAWPFARRIAIETLRIDPGMTRDLLDALLLCGAAALIVTLALVWRRARLPLLVAAGVAICFAPWPDTRFWLADAVPTSFQEQPFTVASIARGAPLYAAHCAACHGNDGRGSGPLAATLVRWPPTVVGPLFGHRMEGEMVWRVLYGMHDLHGTPTMPAFAGKLADAEVWDVLNYMKQLAAGGGAQSGAGWPVPVALPRLDVRCGSGPVQSLAAWRGTQRVRVVALDVGAHNPPPREDIRWQTLLLAPDDAQPSARALDAWSDENRASCVAVTRGSWNAFAGIAGMASRNFAGAQLLADRKGWLRARSNPGDAIWARAALLCTSAGRRDETSALARGNADPLTALLQRIDDEPVKNVKGGYVH